MGKTRVSIKDGRAVAARERSNALRVKSPWGPVWVLFHENAGNAGASVGTLGHGGFLPSNRNGERLPIKVGRAWYAFDIHFGLLGDASAYALADNRVRPVLFRVSRLPGRGLGPISETASETLGPEILAWALAWLNKHALGRARLARRERLARWAREQALGVQDLRRRAREQADAARLAVSALRAFEKAHPETRPRTRDAE